MDRKRNYIRPIVPAARFNSNTFLDRSNSNFFKIGCPTISFLSIRHERKVLAHGTLSVCFGALVFLISRPRSSNNRINRETYRSITRTGREIDKKQRLRHFGRPLRSATRSRNFLPTNRTGNRKKVFV